MCCPCLNPNRHFRIGISMWMSDEELNSPRRYASSNSRCICPGDETNSASGCTPTSASVRPPCAALSNSITLNLPSDTSTVHATPRTVATAPICTPIWTLLRRAAAGKAESGECGLLHSGCRSILLKSQQRRCAFPTSTFTFLVTLSSDAQFPRGRLAPVTKTNVQAD